MSLFRIPDLPGGTQPQHHRCAGEFYDRLDEGEWDVSRRLASVSHQTIIAGAKHSTTPTGIAMMPQ